MFNTETIALITSVAHSIKVPPAALLAVAEVESAGRATDVVNGRAMPLIRWEGHYFYRRLSGTALSTAVRDGLASPKVGGIPNPRTQQGRYDLLDRAKRINEAAALESCSWGLGQVMGGNWRMLGYASVHELVEEAVSGVAGQVAVMARFIKATGLVDELQALQWTAFARQYNGPGFAANRYDTKMADAYARWARVVGATAPVRVPTGWVGMGAKGDTVRAIQTALRRAGYTVNVDGDFGPATKAVVIEFQKANGLLPDGRVGGQTQAALDALSAPPAKMVAPDAAVAPVGKATVGLGFAGVTLSEAAQAISPHVSLHPWVGYAFVGLIVIGAAVTIYGTLFARRERPA